MDPILDIIDAALKRKGLSDAAASKLAVGHPSLIKNLRMPREGEKRYNLPSLMRLAEVLDLEFHFGPPRDPIAEPVVDPASYAQIPVHHATLSAGSGALNGNAEVIGHLAFRRDWLTKVGISPGHARVARIWGDSMAPGIADGDLVLIDTARTLADLPKRAPKDRRPGPIYAFKQDGEARVKRLERIADRSMALLSDNPAFQVEVIDPTDRDFELLGQVVWSGHVWR
jgi:hypothetical protein